MREILVTAQVVCGTMGLSTATVKLIGPGGVQQVGTSVGTGPVDASYKAVDQIVKVVIRPLSAIEMSRLSEIIVDFAASS